MLSLLTTWIIITIQIYIILLRSLTILCHLQILNSFRSSYEDPSNLSESLLLEDTDQITWNNDLRHSNFLKLRLPAKNSIVTFNAFQKVFRPRIGWRSIPHELFNVIK